MRRVHVSWRRRRLGVGVTDEEVRGILASGKTIVESATIPITMECGRDAAVAQLLDRLARRRWPRPRVYAAIGPDNAQLRRLGRLPALGPHELTELVRANVGRFFIRNGVPLVTSQVAPVRPGEAWAAAVAVPVIGALTNACRERGLRLALVVPARAVLDHATQGSAEYADALGATLVARTNPLAIRAGSPGWPERDEIPRWRLIVAAAALVCALSGALLTPVAAELRAARAARVRLAAIDRDRRAALWTTRELETTSSALAQLSAFAEKRRAMTAILASLTRALSPGASLVSLRFDEGGGSLVILAPRAASVLPELDDARELTQAAIVGAISSEVVNGERLERMTIRFQWARRGLSVRTS